MKFHGTKDKLKNIVVDAVPGGVFDNFKEGLLYRVRHGATITWWSSTGTIHVQAPPELKKLTEDRLRNFLHPDQRKIDTADFVTRPRRSPPDPHPGIRSKFKAPLNALARQR